MIYFKDLPVSSSIQESLAKLGITEPTEIQKKSIPVLLESEKIDFHGQAQTGTGKTFAFGIPLVQRITVPLKKTQALIVAPTRELVLQICESLEKIAAPQGIAVTPIYGGMPMFSQVRALKQGAHIVVGTPGRLKDHLMRKTLMLNDIQTVVLDEADIMLDMGFKEDIEDILQYTPKERNIWLFSATIKGGIDYLKKRYMKDVVTVKSESHHVTTTQIQQFYCPVSSANKFEVLCRFIDTATELYGLVFCQTKVLASEISDKLTQRGYKVAALHGDMSQSLRNNVIKKFREKKFSILVATDVAARGIDISDLTHVINYSLPEDHESYVHRVGRTGRAGKEGIAITLTSRYEIGKVKMLGRKFSASINQIEVPGIDEILNMQVNNATTYFEQACARALESDVQALDSLRVSLERCSKEQLLNGLVNVLSDSFLKSYIGKKDVVFAEKEFSRSNNNGSDDTMKELSLNVGSDDGLKQEDVIALLRDVGCANDAIVKLRMIRRRTFVTVHDAQAQTLLSALRGKKIAGRRINVQYVQDQFGGDHREKRPFVPKKRFAPRGARSF